MRLHFGPLEKRLTHMPFTHALTGSNPVRVTTHFFTKAQVISYEFKCNSRVVPIAQLDRAFDYGSKGWGFKSSWVRHVREVA
jgi:hypothetical protein